ncbi:Ribokinase [hydrothermal vent metagenome]|uniref:Ribokinase n=1 Tax=hydrothermal vent metagenome TaxID=652676 RepID=A0A3B0T2J6_9ZZZZ
MSTEQSGRVAILGIFVADVAFRAPRQPKMGETILGSEFRLGPGGKGANQAVAVARLGGGVDFITMLGRDDFAKMALGIWKSEGVNPVVTQTDETYTGAAYIFLEEATGENAIIVCPGAAGLISPAVVQGARARIEGAKVFVTQLEQPIEAARAGLQIATDAGVTTILNPAPAASLDDAIFPLCDYVTPNESEAEALTGIAVTTVDDARKAAEAFLARGVGAAVITLGENGVLFHNSEISVHVPAVHAGPVVETTGAGDAFNGAMALALAWGGKPLDAMRFGCAVAGISVTRAGTAPSMPSLEEVEKIFSLPDV